MKARKKSDHQNLLAEVISQLQSRFIPKGKYLKESGRYISVKVNLF